MRALMQNGNKKGKRMCVECPGRTVGLYYWLICLACVSMASASYQIEFFIESALTFSQIVPAHFSPISC